MNLNELCVLSIELVNTAFALLDSNLILRLSGRKAILKFSHSVGGNLIKELEVSRELCVKNLTAVERAHIHHPDKYHCVSPSVCIHFYFIISIK